MLRGMNSPRFLEWSRKKRILRKQKKKLKKIRNKYLMKEAFKKLKHPIIEINYSKLKSKGWKKIVKKFKKKGYEYPPLLIERWFCEI